MLRGQSGHTVGNRSPVQGPRRPRSRPPGRQSRLTSAARIRAGCPRGTWPRPYGSRGGTSGLGGAEDRRQITAAMHDAHQHDPARLRLVEEDIPADREGEETGPQILLPAPAYAGRLRKFPSLGAKPLDKAARRLGALNNPG